MVDKDTILQIICGLMKHPQYLSESDKYNLTTDDFSTSFEKYVFAAIYNLYKSGAEVISPVDVDNYFNTHKTAKAIFDREGGIEYLQDALDFSQEENFPFYYRRLKKFNCLRDLKRMGFNISRLYEEDLTNDRAKEINDRFEQMEISDIFDFIKKDMLKIETSYSTGDASETVAATKNIEKLLEDLKLRPEIGANLQGDIFNTICRGARRTKFYIRSADSGTGKTRDAVGDACYLSYPVRFNPINWNWECKGSNEKTLFIATEQSLDEIQTLILAYLTGINEEKILFSNYTEKEAEIIAQAIQVMKVYEDNLMIVRLSNPNIEQIKAVVRQNWILHDIKNVFYDYIFSSPSLLNEFRDLKIREDVVLGMLSTALKDLAVEMNLFIMSSTQTNAKSNEAKGIKNETVIRGSRAIIDKCDIGCVSSEVTQEELELLKGVIEETGLVPNRVLDIYKVRRGKYSNVRVWSETDLGTCRKKDLFVTNEKYQRIEDFRVMSFEFDFEKNKDIIELTDKLNGQETKKEVLPKKKVVNSSIKGLID